MRAAPRRAFALALGLAGAPAAAQTPIVIDLTVPDDAPRYFAVPFTVPEGVREIEVRHDDRSEANILDWGLADPTRVRGWGGGNTEPAVVGVDAASRSYLAGPIPAGSWSVLVGQARVQERPARAHLEIVLRTAPTLPAQPERRPYAHVAPLATGPRWYAGDFHVHSRESGDASPTLDEVAAYARSRGLDFVELSEHNTLSQLDFITAAQARHPALLFVPGSEVTTYGGHANAIGATRPVDFRVGGTDPSLNLQTIAAAIDAQGALLAINHPVLNLGDLCIGCAWTLGEAPGRVSAVELQNGQYSVTGTLFFARSVRFWEAYLARGEHIAPIGGSDDHRAGQDRGNLASPIGGPTTLVYATELSVPAILAGVRAGRTVVKLQGPDDPMVDLRAGDSALLGDTVRAPRTTLRATVTGARGATLSFVRNGAAEDGIAVNADPFTATREVDAPAGAQDDRWRCELTVNGQPRVITGHIWLAATQTPCAPMRAPRGRRDGLDARAVDVARGPGAAGDAAVTRPTSARPRDHPRVGAARGPPRPSPPRATGVTKNVRRERARRARAGQSLSRARGIRAVAEGVSSHDQH
ncbi:MAG: CehA/McbA family metallohydrolase [Polyangiales bacterium]